MFLCCKEKLINLRKLLDFEIENPTAFPRLKPLVVKICIVFNATKTEKINTVNYIFKENIFYFMC